MKKIIVTLVLIFSATLTFASTSKQDLKTVIPKENVKLTYPSGSGTVTDACGNEYEIEWSCNYNCSGLAGVIAVTQAIQEWADDNTDCGFAGYSAD